MLRYTDIGNISTSPYVWKLDTDTIYYGWNEIDVDVYDTAGKVSNHQFIFIYRNALIYLPILIRK